MRSYVKVLMLLGLVVLVMPLIFGFAIGPIGAITNNNVEEHATSKDLTNGTCNGCHDRLTRNESTDVDHLAAHRRHIVSAFLNFSESTTTAGNGCGNCHEETVYGSTSYPSGDSNNGVALGADVAGDLSYTDEDTPTQGLIFARAAGKQVKPGVCESCHGEFPTSVHTGNLAQTAPRDCLDGCHGTSGDGGDESAAHTAATYINQRYAASSTFCARCHGELQWYQTTETTESLLGP